MYVCNKETYGYLPVPLRAHNTLQDEADSFLHSLLEVNGQCPASALLPLTSWFLLPVLPAHCSRLSSRPAVRNPPVMPSKYVRVPRKKPDKMGFDEVSNEAETWTAISVSDLIGCRRLAGVHDQPEEAEGSAGAHAEGAVRAEDRL